jgi:hypothetical protein
MTVESAFDSQQEYLVFLLTTFPHMFCVPSDSLLNRYKRLLPGQNLQSMTPITNLNLRMVFAAIPLSLKTS